LFADRINLSGHGGSGNPHSVYKSANRWKGTTENKELKRLIGTIRSDEELELDDVVDF
jgi:hypothetical protein